LPWWRRDLIQVTSRPLFIARCYRGIRWHTKRI
jgi:hypothetical protein